MNILLLEPYLTGSHAAWAQQYAACSRHRVEVLGLPGRHWKWRMHGGALTLARRWLAAKTPADLLLATDMLDLTTFLAMTRALSGSLPCVLYFHENQLTYPWSPRDADPGRRRDLHYAFINVASAAAADVVLFNSRFHQEAFLDELPRFLRHFPDCREPETVAAIRAKSRVLSLGLDLRRFDACRPLRSGDNGPPLILWNHRWEYDKHPEEFFRALFVLAAEGRPFQVAVLGEAFGERPAIFDEARQRLGERIVHFGYAGDFAEYARWLWRADILPVTSIHDFFGISVVEAMYCDIYPLLPERLAYPEHVPKHARARHLYRSFEELLDRLRVLLDDAGQMRTASARTWVQGYDWRCQGPRYDDLFAALAGRADVAGYAAPEAFCYNPESVRLDRLIAQTMDLPKASQNRR